MWLLFFLTALLSSSCALGPARVQAGIARAIAPANPETPATVQQTSMPIPAGSTVEIRREVPSPAPAPGTPAVPPSLETVTVHPAAATVLTFAQASTGTQRPPDKAVEIRKADNAARAPLLYAMLAALLAAGVCIYLEHPTPACFCGLGAGGLFLAWRSASLPDWVWVVAVVAVVIAVALVVGHELGSRWAKKVAARIAAAVPT